MSSRAALGPRQARPKHRRRFGTQAWSGGEVLLDAEMEWFKAVGGGTVDRKSLAAWIVRALMLPFTRAHANLAQGKGVEGNLLGEGMVTGG